MEGADKIVASEQMVGLRARVLNKPWIRTDIGRVGVVDGLLPQPHLPGSEPRLWLADPRSGERFGHYMAGDLAWADEGIAVTYRHSYPDLRAAEPHTRVFRNYRDAGRLLADCAHYENMEVVEVRARQYHLDDLAGVRLGNGVVLPPAEKITVLPG